MVGVGTSGIDADRLVQIAEARFVVFCVHENRGAVEIGVCELRLDARCVAEVVDRAAVIADVVAG